MLTKSARSKVLQSFLVFSLILSVVPMSFAEVKYRRVYDYQTRQYVYEAVPNTEAKVRDNVNTALKNPLVKQALIGAAVGGATGLLSDRTSVLRGMGIGALVGTGTGLIDKSTTLEDKPLARRALKGAVIGTGASAVSRRGAMRGALLGAAAGGGYHFLKDYLNNENAYEDDYYRY